MEYVEVTHRVGAVSPFTRGEVSAEVVFTPDMVDGAARLAANPGQVSKRDSAGQFTRQRGAGFSGFTLAEQAVLNRYRKRATG